MHLSTTDLHCFSATRQLSLLGQSAEQMAHAACETLE